MTAEASTADPAELPSDKRPPILTRAPNAQDAASVHALVRATKVLEANTTYAYVLLTHHFSETCIIAESGDKIVGCALGYRKPTEPSTLFLWQIGTDPAHQGRGIAKRLLRDLAARPSLSDITTLETTIAPSNQPSRGLFESWAQEMGATAKVTGSFEPELFGAENHEAELVFHIAPLTPSTTLKQGEPRS